MKRQTTPSDIAHICGMLLLSSIFGWMWYSASAHSDTPPDMLLAPTRDRLRICVHMLPALQDSSAQIADALAQSIATVRREHADWSAAGYGEAPLIEPCPADIPSFDSTTQAPADRAVPQPKTKWKELKKREEAGPYRTVIYVTDQQTIQNVMHTQNVEWITVEFIAHSADDSSTVTQGLVISHDYLANPNFTNYYLPLSLGLAPLQSYADSGQ